MRTTPISRSVAYYYWVPDHSDTSVQRSYRLHGVFRVIYCWEDLRCVRYCIRGGAALWVILQRLRAAREDVADGLIDVVKKGCLFRDRCAASASTSQTSIPSSVTQGLAAREGPTTTEKKLRVECSE